MKFIFYIQGMAGNFFGVFWYVYIGKKSRKGGDTLGPRVRLVYRGKIYAYILLFIYLSIQITL